MAANAMTDDTSSASVHPGRRVSPMPAPAAQERPCAFADRVGTWCISSKSSQYRKAHGLYLTPVPVADFMASQIKVSGKTLRLLDPAAGAGVLCCAAVERLAARRQPPACIELTAYEDDTDLRHPLSAVLLHLADWCRSRRVRLEAHIESADFVAAEASALRPPGELLPAGSPNRNYDAVIANPPYFKIGRNDPRALAAASVVHGQPNIYALFMAVGAAALRQSGGFVYIVPRSFASGPYFRQFRSTFFELVQPAAIHAFGSRRSTFSRDDVLQENVILAGRRRDGWLRNRAGGTVMISASRGALDIKRPTRRRAPTASVLNPHDPDRVLRLPLSDDDASVLELVEGWPCTLRDLGLNISTGPVVPFRAASAVCAAGDVPATHAPLLWMNHIRPMQATWPLRRRKKEYLLRDGAERLLVPNRNYVLIRRFSAKDGDAAADGGALCCQALRFCGLGPREPPQLRSSAGRHTVRRRILGLGGAVQQPPARLLLPLHQRQHPGQRHRTARHASAPRRRHHRLGPPCAAHGRPAVGAG